MELLGDGGIVLLPSERIVYQQDGRRVACSLVAQVLHGYPDCERRTGQQSFSSAGLGLKTMSYPARLFGHHKTREWRVRDDMLRQNITVHIQLHLPRRCTAEVDDELANQLTGAVLHLKS